MAKETKFEYKGKEYSIEDYINVVRKMSKKEILNIVSKPTHTRAIAEYVKKHPEVLEK